MTQPPLPDRLILNIAAIGRVLLAGLAMIGRASRFGWAVVWRSLTPPWYPARLVEQLLTIGWLSLPVVGLTAIFTGAALAQQIYTGGSRFNAQSTVPAIVMIGMVRELAPVLAGLMVSGRVSSAMAAEIGTMRVTEQLDAMVTLRTDPYRYLFVPRMVASVVALPVLVIAADAIGIFGGWLLSVNKLGFNSRSYLSISRQYLEWDDVVMSLVKAAVFGFIIALMGCYHGYRSSGGAAGVGRATTNAVVSAFILILLSNLILTVLAFG